MNSRPGPSASCWRRGRRSGAAARDIDLDGVVARNWVEQARADRTKGKTGLTTAEREELVRLRKEIASCGGAGHPKKMVMRRGAPTSE